MKKSDFNAEEWSTIAEAPLLAGMRVVTASHGGTLRETVAMGKTYAEARRQHGDSELLDDLVATPPAIDPARLRESGGVGAAATERLREAVELLEQKGSPEAVDAYKRFVLTLAKAAAEAHREGGVMGLGGKQVSEEEQAALDEIAATLQTGAA